MIPTEVLSDLNQDKNPSNRILIRLLVASIVFIFGLLMKSVLSNDKKADGLFKDCAEEKRILRREVDSLKYEGIKSTIQENRLLRERDAYQDSVKKELESLIKALQK